MFYDPLKPPVLECQLCGAVLKTLTREEADIVAERPYDFITYCAKDRAVGLEIESRRDFG